VVIWPSANGVSACSKALTRQKIANLQFLVKQEIHILFHPTFRKFFGAKMAVIQKKNLANPKIFLHFSTDNNGFLYCKNVRYSLFVALSLQLLLPALSTLHTYSEQTHTLTISRRNSHRLK
jgi:hypothetical protein